MARRSIAWDLHVLWSLEDEFAFSNRAETEERIRKRLKRRKLGPYDQARVDELRGIKDFLQREVAAQERSRYWLGMSGHFVAMTDFDVAGLTRDVIARHPRVTRMALRAFVARAVALYHLL